MSDERVQEDPVQAVGDPEAEDQAGQVGLDQQLESLEKEKKDLYDRLLRKQAELENYRKRAEKEKTEIRQRARSAVLCEFLSVLDNCERGLQHLQESEEKSPELENYRQGLELIYKQVRTIFENLGVKEIPTTGKLFDPNVHEAIQREESPQHRESEIVDEIRKGYTFNDQLLRPAQVKVAVKSGDY